ncbi:hypothetical protein BXT84_10625 [Sulfobacillus thermotolerans]|uniref:Amidase domain-containing protein n=1 Tax=Sulfobacillus thermotolerans TaxID=338644 RepID=A0ABN5H163_9FIRM|nr:hypothetical protein BXT84_10625 [Sulfobacillus thermotolerans]
MKSPEFKDFKEIAQSLGLQLSDEELGQYYSALQPSFDGYVQLETLSQEKETPFNEAREGHLVDPQDNPLGAWYWKGEIVGAKTGLLVGKRVVIKDNVAVAGMPLSNGTSLMADFRPSEDATVVQRILGAGGTIVGQSVCENLCFSGSSFTSDTGPVRNPYDPSRSSGGSSSGSAVLLATGEVDMAIGGDQGGSIRIPAAWCGVYGLKPTWGLVPYTGAFPIEPSLDHLGPMARTVPDVARLLEVIAGPDGNDPRQKGLTFASSGDYMAALGQELRGFRLGVVKEGFGWPQSDPRVDDMVWGVSESLESKGVSLASVSIPWHRQAMLVWNAIAVEGTWAVMMKGNASGYGWKGRYSADLMSYWAKAWRQNAAALPATVKQLLLVASYMEEHTYGKYYAMAQNLAGELRRAYDNALKDVDLLVMPTLPMTATRLPGKDDPIAEQLNKAFEMVVNTAPFDVSGHPAMTLPCGLIDGLPVGMMIVGKYGDEATLLRFADAFARQVSSPPSPPEAVKLGQEQ